MTPAVDPAVGPCSVLDVLSSAGQPLPGPTRGFFESRFGRDFSAVRVHTDSAAAESARAVYAEAYTVGNDIVFARGAYAPQSAHGRRLLAHELVHTSQHQGVGLPTSGLAVSRPHDAAEREATAAAAGGVVATVPVVRIAQPTLMRQTPGVGAREARGTAGELSMGFAYRRERGWGFLAGPGGSGGHRWNDPGFDGVAFRTEGAFEIHIIDNKSWARTGNVGSASALTDNLLKNLDDLIKVANGAEYDAVPRIGQVRSSLMKAHAAVLSKAKLPAEVHLVVTSHGGRSTGVTKALEGRGVRFIGAADPVPTLGTAGTPPAAGGSQPPAPAPGGTGSPPGPTSTVTPVKPRSGPAAKPLPSSAPLGGVGQVARTVSQVTSSEARAIAAETGRNLRTTLRMLKVAWILSTTLRVMQVIGAFLDFASFLSMARGGLAGEGFILRREIAQFRQMELDIDELRLGYAKFSEKVVALQYQLLKLGPNPDLVVRAMTDLTGVRNQIAAVQSEVSTRLASMREALKEVEAKERAALSILEDPIALAAISTAHMSTAPAAEIFAASQDFLRIRSHLRSSVEGLEVLQAAMQEDIEFLDSWWRGLFEVVLRVGLGRLSVELLTPLAGDAGSKPTGGTP
ncbi:DUF4157 domain-containing protein [Streptomyces sp. ODS28]|uniref:eCIS core domain-containing protein n=1 Tax=Streptomyces sp. ODS28 TaxID=3136688 RepID=UPI0031E6313C